MVPFALTVDCAGHSYLKTMCEDIGYEMVADTPQLRNGSVVTRVAIAGTGGSTA